LKDANVDNQRLIEVNMELRAHDVEKIGQTLRGYMSAMKRIV
jgi:ketol-acid reductoisomerase